LKAEIVSIGTELLFGEIDDTNATYISRLLTSIGIDVHLRHAVDDELARIVQVLGAAMRRSDAVITCGGLGPTPDDLTRQAVAQITNRALQTVPAAEQQLRDFFAKRHRKVSSNNLRQCQVPRGGQLLGNSVGTAPGLLIEHEGCTLIAVPGPPPEMRQMMTDHVMPYLRERLTQQQQSSLFTRTLRIADIGESDLAQQLEDILAGQTDPALALYASPGEVRIRMHTKAPSQQEANKKLGDLENSIRQRLGEHIYGTDDETMEVAVGQVLVAAGATLAVAESCTGGLIASRITDVPGSSRYFQGGYVTYSNELKQQLLGVPAQIIQQHGTVSEECAQAMAEGARQGSGADYALAVTGIAGPDGGTPQKPVGRVYIAVADEQETICQQFDWPGTRSQFKQRTSQMALNMLRKRVLGIV